MKILQLDYSQLSQISGQLHMIVESQEYGQLEDFRFHVVMTDTLADKLSGEGVGRVIADTGRTIGFWQRLGGRGVYRPELVNISGFNERVTRIVSKMKPAQINFNGETWNDIILVMAPHLNAEVIESLNLQTSSAKPASRKAKTTRSPKSKKTAGKSGRKSPDKLSGDKMSGESSAE